MSESILNTRWVPPSLFRRTNVAKYEAATGRLIWWRKYELGESDLVPREIAPIHGTLDVVAWMRGTKIGGGVTDFLFRIPECGGQEMECVPWSHSLGEEYFQGDNPFAMPPTRPQNDLLHAADNGDTYAAGAFYLADAEPPISLPWVKGFTPNGTPSTNFNLGVTLPGLPPFPNQFLQVVGIPASDDLVFSTAAGTVLIGPTLPNIAWITKLTYRVGPGGSSTRHFLHNAKLVCANAAGHCLYSFRTIRPYGVGAADLRGIVVSNHTGADVSFGGYTATWLLDITPTDVTLLDNSIVAQLTDSFLEGHGETVAPGVCVPQVGCAHGGDWIFTNDEDVGPISGAIRRTDSSLATIWQTALTQTGTVRKIFTDSSGIYVVQGAVLNDTPCAVIKLDHSGNVLFGVTAPFVSRAACLDHDEQYLYVIG